MISESRILKPVSDCTDKPNVARIRTGSSGKANRLSVPEIFILCNSAIEMAALKQRFGAIASVDSRFHISILNLNELPESLKPDSSLVVVDLPRWASNHVQAMEHVRKRYKGPIVLVVSNIGLWAGRVEAWPILKNVGFVERPFEATELLGIIRRFALTKVARFRVFPRYEVELPAILNSFDTSQAKTTVTCTIRNVSHGGACVELNEAAPLTVGQFANLSFSLDDKDQKRDVRCRIVWIENESRLMGAEFVQTIGL